MIDLDRLEADAQDAPSDSQLGELTQQLREYRRLSEEASDLERALKDVKARLHRMETTDLPEKMDEIGTKEFTMSDGTKVKVEDFVSGSIPKAKQHEAVEWLRHNGHADLVANIVSVEFTRTEDNVAQDVYQALCDRGLPAKRNETVNHMTLKAWAREQLARGEEIPLELLGLFVGRRIKVKES